MILSRIPLTGLCDIVSVKRQSVIQQYGIMVPSTRSTIYDSLKCRLTLLNMDEDKDMMYVQGRDSSKIWKLIAPVKTLVQKEDIIVVGEGYVTPAGSYKIFYVRLQKDHMGGMHHLSAFMEEL